MNTYLSGRERETDAAGWRRLAKLASEHQTPFFLVWGRPFAEAQKYLQSKVAAVGSVRQWYSFKTQPIPHLAVFARSLGMGIEVVSEFELAAGLKLGFAPNDILVNGVAKHRWIDRNVSGLNVVFDSLHEITQLASTASRLRWRCGLRVAVSAQINADQSDQPAQFGIDPQDLQRACNLLGMHDLPVDILHFHLRSSVPSSAWYKEALVELAGLADRIGISPRIIDVGGGLPDWSLTPPTLTSVEDEIRSYLETLAWCTTRFRDLKQIWLENGRHLLGRSAILVVTVSDVKYSNGFRILICDGGRTNQALPSDWEYHAVEPVQDVSAPDTTTDTIACGPTCMAYDFFYRGQLPRSVQAGDRLIYFNAGAYHLPWETRFSTGLCKVLWTPDGTVPLEIRSPESVEDWTSRWSGFYR
jgi:diaminopimelate decarboxylase